MKSIVLKGHNDGYEISLKDSASFTDILKELKLLFADLSVKQTFNQQESVAFEITTGTRLLLAEQRKAIEAIVSAYPQFTIYKFSADVILTSQAREILQQKSLHLEGGIIRNGQVKELTGDVLFIGTLHQGGMLRTTGSIFLLGNCEGILQAGYPNDSAAVIVGDFHRAQQIRISDAIAIIAQEKQAVTAETAAYVNDLHVLDYTKREQVKQIRPKLFARTGGL
ncbi:MAG: septum site-determining protein MinC [Liquorilactobacillus ghanensis]|jgi:septum site-determining protein MinC|uniref:Cell division inhibitor n=1 Tax=Liquorilactobacillus ghanensis DSM 18630 TaxID=1423750 RepID=A0A0R1VQ04_9LACO|nr:septum site-determining protein MinC [Liquorilactobacillus ghanensis]KRM07902.1 cell division inhibitor [Liquorilactobacillus ghanensis DSM 18630]